MMQRSNRKSHLTAPLSPATQALLRSEGPFSSGHSPSRDTTNSKTPTSGEIPIAASSSTAATSSASSSSSYHQEPAIQRVLSAEVNGSHGLFPNQSPLERPSFPPRTSSTSVLASRQKDENLYTQATNMPIRPAPPPGGPLPQPPGTSSKTSNRRQGMSNITYPNGEGRPI